MPNAMPPANPEKTMKKNWHRGPEVGVYWTEIVERGDSGPSTVIAQVRTKRLEGVYSGELKIVECQEGEANLRLLLAALELLEAAKSARDALAVAIKTALEGSTDADVAEHVVIKKLDAAIARATGRETSND